MCQPRKPVDISLALAAVTSIADHLSSPDSSGASLASVVSSASTWTRIVRRVEIVNSGIVAETRCALPRPEE